MGNAARLVRTRIQEYARSASRLQALDRAASTRAAVIRAQHGSESNQRAPFAWPTA
jgi:hypothetical protein